MQSQKESKVGIISTGFVARGLSYSLRSDKFLGVSRVLTRRQPEQVCDLAVENRRITNSVQELIDTSDIIVECSGDPVHATKVLMEVMKAGYSRSYNGFRVAGYDRKLVSKEGINNRSGRRSTREPGCSSKRSFGYGI